MKIGERMQQLEDKVGYIGDRMTKIETQVEALTDRNACEHDEIKDVIHRMEGKLDVALEKKADREEIKTKADKDELNKLDAKFWALVIGFILAFLGIITTALKAWFGKV